ncbi:rhomboid family intramembrane serine protease [Geopsychrobacter electrodiphilus]|uniref:rhomboid family intramembrane serine protease n=1 Tax=Geopsychrobacter electrodiphilus TaxID=225196 RepID=UPI0003A38C4E|nr:rhomboid family intramembrane serine protease [Geopsychrobacter electrodiphilus]
MFLPIGDSPRASSTPWMTWLLIGLNVTVYLGVTLPAGWRPPALDDPLLAEYLRMLGVHGPVPISAIQNQITVYDLLVFRYGFRPASFNLISLFCSLFLHAGLFHLAGNMLFLYIFGDNVEHRLGPLKYLCAYLFFGVAATLFFGLFVPHSNVPLIGASGAISGVMGCYFLWFPRNRVKVFVFLFPLIMTSLMIPARWVLGFYLLVENLVPFLVSSSGGGVAHGAHIGGFLAGLGLVFVVERLHLRFRFQKTPVWDQNSCSPQTIPWAVAAGELEAASRCYLGLMQPEERKVVPPETALALGDYLLSRGEDRAALKIFRRFIAERQNSPGLDRAYLGAGKILLQQTRYVTSAYHYLLSAIELASTPDIASEARAGIQRIEGLQRRGGRPLAP